MKRLFISIIAILSVVAVSAQEQDPAERNTIYIGSDGQNRITTDDGNISLTIAGVNLEFGNSGSAANNKENPRITFSAFEERNTDHLALFEVGVNTLVNTDYSMYSKEEAAMLQFGNRKSTYIAINLLSMDVTLNKRGTWSFNMGFGFGCERYAFAGPYSMQYADGMMRPVKLEGDIKKSQLGVDYIHMPFLINWNFSKKFFVAAGANLDIVMNNFLRYKKPITTIERTVTVNPVQISASARIGYGKLYGFVNYSFLEMFKSGTGPKANRLSAGVGLFF